MVRRGGIQLIVMLDGCPGRNTPILGYDKNDNVMLHYESRGA